ncbi:3,4-dihydroxy-2-butanone-4-phosphate synthase [Candidatus Woesearchaeota archaeon]|nr:3,4-dihydroxy-2-butanone-4-phosphate synthase [Candidatus Woesearchaeota archaeon]
MFSKIGEAIQDIKRGRFVIIVDDESRENEGDLVIAAESATPSKINFMLKHARGILCVPVIGKRLDELNLPLMVYPHDISKCAFTISVDFRNGTTTGTSVFDRALTIKSLTNDKFKAKDFSRPGHIFPLRYEEGGVLEREGHTEASVDLAKLAGLYPAAVICEILKDDGTMAKLPELLEFSESHGIKIITIQDLKNYIKNENVNKQEIEV